MRGYRHFPSSWITKEGGDEESRKESLLLFRRLTFHSVEELDIYLPIHQTGRPCG